MDTLISHVNTNSFTYSALFLNRWMFIRATEANDFSWGKRCTLQIHLALFFVVWNQNLQLLVFCLVRKSWLVFQHNRGKKFVNNLKCTRLKRGGGVITSVGVRKRRQMYVNAAGRTTARGETAERLFCGWINIWPKSPKRSGDGEADALDWVSELQ